MDRGLHSPVGLPVRMMRQVSSVARAARIQRATAAGTSSSKAPPQAWRLSRRQTTTRLCPVRDGKAASLPRTQASPWSLEAPGGSRSPGSGPEAADQGPRQG